MPSYPTQTTHSPAVWIEVTQQEIDEGERNHSSHCMIAAALKKAMPNWRNISVDLQTIRGTDPSAGYRYVYLTPRVAQELLVNFDDGREVKPFRVKIRYAHVLPSIKMKPEEQKKLSEYPKRSSSVGKSKGSVFPVGGRTPPVSRDLQGTPATRRVFGLRALHLNSRKGDTLNGPNNGDTQEEC